MSEIKEPITCTGCGRQFTTMAGMGAHARYSKGCSLEARYWSKVNRRGPDECWNWKASVFKKKNKQMGYGRFAGSGPYTYAHRVSWMLTFGPIPEGKIIMHKCDNVLCCNPAHLRVGTDRENIADMKAKGRYRHRYQPIEELLHPELSRKVQR